MMGPEYIQFLTVLLGFLKELGTWPVLVMVMVMIIGPWVLAVLLAWGQSKRFDAVAKMYENNAKLVEAYECLAKDLESSEKAKQDVILYNTRILQSLVDRLDGERRITS